MSRCACGRQTRFRDGVCFSCREVRDRGTRDEDGLTGGRFVTRPGGVKVWVPNTDTTVEVEHPPTSWLLSDTKGGAQRNKLQDKPGRRTVLLRSTCTGCGVLLIGDEVFRCPFCQTSARLTSEQVEGNQP